MVAVTAAAAVAAAAAAAAVNYTHIGLHTSFTHHNFLFA